MLSFIEEGKQKGASKQISQLNKKYPQKLWKRDYHICREEQAEIKASNWKLWIELLRIYCLSQNSKEQNKHDCWIAQFMDRLNGRMH